VHLVCSVDMGPGVLLVSIVGGFSVQIEVRLRRCLAYSAGLAIGESQIRIRILNPFLLSACTGDALFLFAFVQGLLLGRMTWGWVEYGVSKNGRSLPPRQNFR
jgi:hypothetical protein